MGSQILVKRNHGTIGLTLRYAIDQEESLCVTVPWKHSFAVISKNLSSSNNEVTESVSLEPAFTIALFIGIITFAFKLLLSLLIRYYCS